MTPKPRRIRLSRTKGWRLPDNAVNVARPGPWGNPFVVGRDGDRARCVELYATLLDGIVALGAAAGIDAQHRAHRHVLDNLPALRGKDLACWCPLDGGPCHADLLLALANAPEEDTASRAGDRSALNPSEI